MPEMMRRFLLLAAVLVAVVCPVRGQSATGSDSVAPATMRTYADEMPTYPGGLMALHTYLAQKTEFPTEAKRLGLSGTVVVQFVVDEQGSVLNPYVVNSTEPLFNAEAIRLARLMPWWMPGRQQHQAVKVLCTLPIQFTFRR